MARSGAGKASPAVKWGHRTKGYTGAQRVAVRRREIRENPKCGTPGEISLAATAEAYPFRPRNKRDYGIFLYKVLKDKDI
jgi:hypothetical protein